MKTVLLRRELLIGTLHEPPGKAIELPNHQADQLIRLGYAEVEGPKREADPPTVETVSRSPNGRKAARLSGKAD